MIDGKLNFVLYLTFMTEMIIFKAILKLFPHVYLCLNTPRVKMACAAAGIIQFLLCIGVVTSDILNGDCNLISATDMYDHYDLVDKTYMNKFIRHRNNASVVVTAVFIVHPISWCYEIFVRVYQIIKNITCKSQLTTQNAIQPAAINFELLPLKRGQENSQNKPDSHSIMFYIIMANIVGGFFGILRFFLSDSYYVTFCMVIIGRFIECVFPLYWFLNYEDAVNFISFRIYQFKLKYFSKLN